MRGPWVLSDRSMSVAWLYVQAQASAVFCIPSYREVLAFRLFCPSQPHGTTLFSKSFLAVPSPWCALSWALVSSIQNVLR